jgi:hypothetical protein
VNPLLELLDTIYLILLGQEEASWTSRIARAADLDPFLKVLRANGEADGLHACGELSLCLDGAVLVYEVQPLITPDRRNIADGAFDDLETNGVSIRSIRQPHPGVLAFSGSSSEGALEGRIVPARGWIFLISASDETSLVRLRELLDATIAVVEGRQS